MTKIATDNSYYQIFAPTQYDILASGTDGAVIRLGFGTTLDKSRLTHLNNFRDRGMSVCGYWWIDPTKDKNRQRDMICEETLKQQVPSIFLDAEQYWRDWAAYMRQDLTTCFETRYQPDYLDKYYHDTFLGVLKALEVHGKEVGNYSADWFISKYAPAMSKWIYDHNYWEARYARYYNPAELSNVYKKYGKPFDISKLEELKTSFPIVKGIGRQFESLLYVKGLVAHQDYNFFTDEGFNRMFGTSHPTDPPVEPPTEEPLPPVQNEKIFIINTRSLRIRSGPGTQYPIIGGYWSGQKVSISTVNGDWGLTDKGWINMLYTLPTQNSYVVTAIYLTVREYPSVYSKAVDWLKLGDHVYQIDTSGVWINIGRGWVSSKHLKPV